MATSDHALASADPECIPYLQSSLTLYLKNMLLDSLDNSQSGKISLKDLQYALAGHPHTEATASLQKQLVNTADFDASDDEPIERGIDPQLFSETMGSPPPVAAKTTRPPPNPLKRSSAVDTSFSFPSKRSRKPKAVVLSSDDDEDADGDPDADFRAQW